MLAIFHAPSYRIYITLQLNTHFYQAFFFFCFRFLKGIIALLAQLRLSLAHFLPSVTTRPRQFHCVQERVKNFCTNRILFCHIFPKYLIRYFHGHDMTTDPKIWNHSDFSCDILRTFSSWVSETAFLLRITIYNWQHVSQ